MEKRRDAVEACSGCAGDYEDPDRTAWEEDPEDEEAVVGERVERGGESVGEGK